MPLGIGIGLSPLVRHGSFLNLSDEYKAILAATTGTKPNRNVQIAQDAFILREKAAGRWTKYACLLPYAGGMPTASDALIWWNNPARKGTLSATPPEYKINNGFVGDGVAAYIDTTFNFSADGAGKFTQNDNSHGYWFANQRLTTSNGRSGGQPASSGNAIVPSLGNQVYMSDNADYKNVANAIGTQHLFIASRTSSTGFKIYQNDTDLGTQTQSSAALGNFKAYGLWAGQTGANYSTDTIGLQFYASSFSAADVSGLNASWLQLIADLYKANNLSYSAEGTVIDLTKWTVTNPNATVAQFSQNNGLVMDIMTATVYPYTFNNNIKSNLYKVFGVWKFSLLDINTAYGQHDIREVGLFDISTVNRIFLMRNGVSGTLRFHIVQNSVDVYTIDTGVYDFGQFKICISQLNVITLWMWSNDTWVQVGVNKTYKLGALALYMATSGQDITRVIMRDIHIVNDDFTTVNP